MAESNFCKKVGHDYDWHRTCELCDFTYHKTVEGKRVFDPECMGCRFDEVAAETVAARMA